jgi:hypothetical protein
MHLARSHTFDHLWKAAFLASHTTVDISSAFQPSVSRAFFSGAGLFLLRASGRGSLAVNAHGGIVKYSLSAGETRAVDNGHLVAWDASMKYEVGMASRRGGFLGSVVNSAASGEGLMCFFHGPGRLWLQTHKRPGEKDSKGNGGRTQGASVLFVLIFFLVIVIMFIAVSQMARQNFASQSKSPYRTRHGQRHGGKQGAEL